MIDIHSHLIPNVDDGSKSIGESIDVLKKLEKDGITDIILTPHVHSIATRANRQTQIKQFEVLKNVAKSENININLYLGAEIMYLSHIDIDYSKYTLNNSKYILIEFNSSYNTQIEDTTYNIIKHNFIPIIAHIERYHYLTIDDIRRIKANGALIQVNSDALIGKRGRKEKKFIKQLLKYQLIDFIASDTHGYKRPSKMKEAYKYLEKRIDNKYLNEMFIDNALKIINNI